MSGDISSSEELYERMVASPGSTMEFIVNRKYQSGVGLSKEAIDRLADNMRLWVYSRMFKHLGTGRGVGGAKVTVHVEFADGSYDENDVTIGRPYFRVADAGLRGEAAGGSN